MAHLHKVLSPIYTTIDFDAIELRPMFSFSSFSSSPVPTMNNEGISISNPSFPSDGYFDEDDRKLSLPIFTCNNAYHYTNGSLRPYWDSIKDENTTIDESCCYENIIDQFYFDENHPFYNSPSCTDKEDNE